MRKIYSFRNNSRNRDPHKSVYSTPTRSEADPHENINMRTSGKLTAPLRPLLCTDLHRSTSYTSKISIFQGSMPFLYVQLLVCVYICVCAHR